MTPRTHVILRGVLGGLLSLSLIAVASVPAGAQGLADYDYDELTFRGIGFGHVPLVQLQLLGIFSPAKGEHAHSRGVD